MKSQPAKISYFFGPGQRRLGSSLADVWRRDGESIKKAASNIADSWRGNVILAPVKTLFALLQLISIAIFGVIFTAVFSLVHITLLMVFMFIIYIGFILLAFADSVYRMFYRISTSCPDCQSKFSLPVYTCSCGANHTRLVPSKYGIAKRRCNCGRKLPTTFFGGRHKLEAHCPVCNSYRQVEGGGHSIDICIPVIGGPSSGKTCLINMAISEFERVAPSYKLEFMESKSGLRDYKSNMQSMKNGQRPMKTTEMRLTYYQFFLSKMNAKVKNLISLCDIGGEVYADSKALSGQQGFKNSTSYLMIIDPLAIEIYRKELINKSVDIAPFKPSAKLLDEILGMITATLQNVLNMRSKDVFDMNLAVVFTKTDIPGLDEVIGDKALSDYIASHHGSTRLEAKNVLCENFLKKYGEFNFLNTLHTKFRKVQFFTCSALGHNVDGTLFKPQGVEESVLWLIDMASKSIDLSDKWNRAV